MSRHRNRRRCKSRHVCRVAVDRGASALPNLTLLTSYSFKLLLQLCLGIPSSRGRCNSACETHSPASGARLGRLGIAADLEMMGQRRGTQETLSLVFSPFDICTLYKPDGVGDDALALVPWYYLFDCRHWTRDDQRRWHSQHCFSLPILADRHGLIHVAQDGLRLQLALVRKWNSAMCVTTILSRHIQC
jgi:hypothetical protein